MGLSRGKGLKGYKVAREDIEKLDTTFSSSGTFASLSSAAEHTYQQFLYAKIFLLLTNLAGLLLLGFSWCN